jgi:hypothetical protein
MSTITLTDEIIALARAIVAQVPAPKPDLYLYNPCTGKAHNDRCPWARGSIAVTHANMWNLSGEGEPADCQHCIPNSGESWAAAQQPVTGMDEWERFSEERIP